MTLPLPLLLLLGAPVALLADGRPLMWSCRVPVLCALPGLPCVVCESSAPATDTSCGDCDCITKSKDKSAGNYCRRRTSLLKAAVMSCATPAQAKRRDGGARSRMPGLFQYCIGWELPPMTCARGNKENSIYVEGRLHFGRGRCVMFSHLPFRFVFGLPLTVEMLPRSSTR